MSNYGVVISKLRKQAKMTQAELGAKMNVSNQAVSKWENDQSQPDFDTIQRLCKLFNITVDDFSRFLNGEEVAASTAAPVAPVTQQQMLGVCTVCGKTVFPDNLGESEPTLICSACAEREREEWEINHPTKERRRELEVSHRRIEVSKRKGRVIASFIVAGIISLVLLIFSLVSGGDVLIGGLIFSVLSFTFTTQLFWGGFIVNFVLGSIKIFTGPGLIFEFDLDGIIWLIGMKILFWFLTKILTLLVFLLGALIAMLLSPFTFLPAAFRFISGRESD